MVEFPVHRIIHYLADNYDPKYAETLSESVEHGEAQDGLEIVIEQLLDDEVPIPQPFAEDLITVAKGLGLEQVRYKYLQDHFA